MKTISTIVLLALACMASAAENSPSDNKPGASGTVGQPGKGAAQNQAAGSVDKPALLSDARRFTPRQRGLGNESLWAWPVSEPGHFCYSARKAPVLWRQSAELPAYLGIRTDAGQTVKLRWPAGENTLPWPQERVPLADGQEFQLTLDEQYMTLLTLHRVPEERLHKAAEKAVWMAQQGCVAQAQKLFEADNPDSLF